MQDHIHRRQVRIRTRRWLWLRFVDLEQLGSTNEACHLAGHEHNLVQIGDRQLCPTQLLLGLGRLTVTGWGQLEEDTVRTIIRKGKNT